MDEGMIGEIRLFAGDWAPLKWLFCDGQQLAIEKYRGLYSVVGDQYGRSDNMFHLPKLAPLNETATGRDGDTLFKVRYVICYEGNYPAPN